MADFDPAKDVINRRKHRIALDRWPEMDIKITFIDDRKDYGEIRHRALGFIDALPHCLVFTIRDGLVRPISLRRAHTKEMRRYVPKTK